MATWFLPPNVRCRPEPTTYEYQEAFRIGVKREAVTLHHAGGELSVDVEDLSPEAEGLVASRSAIGPVLSPAAGIPAEGSEAVGYSRKFDFTEAFQDAIAKIPVPSIPDWLTNYSVLEIGAEIGGITGFNRMFVRVRAN